MTSPPCSHSNSPRSSGSRAAKPSVGVSGVHGEVGVGGPLEQHAAEEAASVTEIRGRFALCEAGGVSDSPRAKAGSSRQAEERALGGERKRHGLCSEAITSSSMACSSITSWCSCSASPLRSRSSRSTPSSLVDEDPPPATTLRAGNFAPVPGPYA